MNQPSSSLVIGGGGLLGNAVIAELRRRGRSARRARVRWESESDAGADLATELEDAAQAGGDLDLWWCAGAGVTATGADRLAVELNVFSAFVDQVADLAARHPAKVTLLLASSAGAVYAGSPDPPFTEQTTPIPLSDYGRQKLRAESVAARLVSAGVGVAIARIANLYGPGQDLSKPQGLMSQLCLSAQLRRPMNIYVSLDTLRDYVHVADAAARCVSLLDAVSAGEPACVIKIVCTGRSVSVGALLSEANRIYRRRVPVVLAASPLGRQQARDLRLRSVVLPELDQVPTHTITAGLGQVRRAVEASTRTGRQTPAR